MFASVVTPAQTLLFTDFSNGIPMEYTCIDNDGLQPSTNVQKLGFTAGKAWIALPCDDDNMAAWSTSYYTPKGTADDWLITPPLQIDINNAQLRWKAKARNSKFRDGYKVMLSSASGNIDDFTTTLCTIEAEENTWQEHAVDLSAYEGKTVRIAFVNNSDNKDCLIIDDVYAGISQPICCTLDLPSVTAIGGQATVNATITNHGETTVNETAIHLTFNGVEHDCSINTPVEPGQTVKAPLPFTLFIPTHERVDYTLSAKAADKTFSYTGSVMSYPRRVVAEEGTATSCSWCIRGVVMMDRMEAKYPDRFISMSAHLNDVMSVDGYINNLNKINDNILLISIPNTVVNRSIMCDPINIEVNFRNQFNQEKVMVAMSSTATYNSETKSAEITSRLHFAQGESNANYRLAYYLVEDSVYHPGNSDYIQANAYSGVSEDWDGYENKGSVITDMRFRNVVRSYNDCFDGIEGSVPASFDADEEITHTYSFPFTANVDKVGKCHFVVMLIDPSDHHIVNACIAPVAISTHIQGITGNSIIASDEYQVYSTDGRLLARGSHLDSLLSGHSGLMVVRQGDKTWKIAR